MRTSVRRRGTRWAVVTATIVLVALAGCSSGADSMSGSVADSRGAQVRPPSFDIQTCVPPKPAYVA